MNASILRAHILDRTEPAGSLGRCESEGVRREVGSKAGATVMPPAAPHTGPQSRHRWGVCLAGGDGVRLKPVTRAICGDERPKQFCPLLDEQSLLAHALRRVELVIPREQTLVSLNGEHCKWFLQEPALRPDQRVVQPGNRGTAPAIAHALLSVARADQGAIVGIFPADHHYSNEALFVESLESAFAGALKHPDFVMLLGARPHCPETSYGWIALGPQAASQPDLFQVQEFQEKPSRKVAESLLSRSSAWNTFVMVGHVQALLKIVSATLPGLVDSLRTARPWAGTETFIEYSAYQRIPAVDFSARVLPASVEQLLVLRLGDVGWCDVGDPGRASRIGSKRRQSKAAA